MLFERKIESARRAGWGGGLVRAGAAAVLALSLSGTAQAFTSLNLIPSPPDINSSDIIVDYDAASGDFFASGFADSLTLPGGGSLAITEGSPGDVFGFFDIFDSNINPTTMTATGKLKITGQVASEGFTSGTLLTGTLRKFGAGMGDPLEFLFDVTGGDAAGLFSSTAAVILSQSGFTGSFASDFGSFSAVSDTYQVPEPGTLGMLMLAGSLVYLRRRQPLVATA